MEHTPWLGGRLGVGDHLPLEAEGVGGTDNSTSSSSNNNNREDLNIQPLQVLFFTQLSLVQMLEVRDLTSLGRCQI